MKTTIARAAVAALVALVYWPSPAAAQQQDSRKHLGEEVVMQSTLGQELRGRLVDLSPTNLSILVDNHPVEVPLDTVTRIDVRNDSLKNGAIIGGAVMGGLSALSCGLVDKSMCTTGMIVNTGIGILAGAGIDALHKGRTPIYVKAGRSNASLQVKLRF